MKDQVHVHFIFSAPRSGSTWLAHALNHHPEILATENRLFGMFCETWTNRDGRSTPRITADRYFQGFANHCFWNQLGVESARELQEQLIETWIEYLIRFLATRSGKTTIVDKVTPYLGTSDRVIRQIGRHFPNAKIIHLVRDGRDVVTSGVFDWIGRSPAESGHARDEFFLDVKPGQVLQRFFDDPSMSQWCRYWSEPVEAIRTCDFQAEQKMEVRFEAMKENHASCLESIFSFLNVDCEPEIAARCAEKTTFEKMTGRPAGQAEPLAKARQGQVGNWSQYFTRRDASLFWRDAGETLVRERYVENGDWIDLCPESLQLVSERE